MSLDAREQLAVLEDLTAIADVMTTMRTNLIARGWSEGAAEQATIVMLPPLIIGATMRGAS